MFFLWALFLGFMVPGGLEGLASFVLDAAPVAVRADRE